MLQEKLTKRQQTIFDFIRNTIENSGYGPTIREIADEMGYRSPNGVMCHLRALQKKGLIDRTNNKSRSIVLTEEAAEEVNGIPLAGRVAAGALMEAIEQHERIVSVSASHAHVCRGCDSASARVRRLPLPKLTKPNNAVT